MCLSQGHMFIYLNVKKNVLFHLFPVYTDGFYQLTGEAGICGLTKILVGEGFAAVGKCSHGPGYFSPGGRNTLVNSLGQNCLSTTSFMETV